MLFLLTAPKTRSEIQIWEYRQRKLQREGVTKTKIKKTRADIQREYRKRKKEADYEAFLKRERERLQACRIYPHYPSARKCDSKRRKENSEKVQRSRSKAKANSSQFL